MSTPRNECGLRRVDDDQRRVLRAVSSEQGAGRAAATHERDEIDPAQHSDPRGTCSRAERRQSSHPDCAILCAKTCRVVCLAEDGFRGRRSLALQDRSHARSKMDVDEAPSNMNDSKDSKLCKSSVSSLSTWNTKKHWLLLTGVYRRRPLADVHHNKTKILHTEV